MDIAVQYRKGQLFIKYSTKTINNLCEKNKTLLPHVICKKVRTHKDKNTKANLQHFWNTIEKNIFITWRQIPLKYIKAPTPKIDKYKYVRIKSYSQQTHHEQG